MELLAFVRCVLLPRVAKPAGPGVSYACASEGLWRFVSLLRGLDCRCSLVTTGHRSCQCETALTQANPQKAIREDGPISQLLARRSCDLIHRCVLCFGSNSLRSKHQVSIFQAYHQGA